MNNRLWVLGAADPEMAAIEKLLSECGERVVYAADASYRRVHPGNAYTTYSLLGLDGGRPSTGGATRVYLVECYAPALENGRELVSLDHHRPGDPGYGKGPEEFLAASSLGQVIAELARLGKLPKWPTVSSGNPARVGDIADVLGDWCVCIASSQPGYCGDADYRGEPSMAIVPRDLTIIAAADHCLAHAYAGRCPGVHRDDVLACRVRVLADRRLGPALDLEDDVRSDIGASLETLEQMTAADHEIELAPGLWVLDTRPAGQLPELPDAASYAGIAYLASPEPRPGGDTRRKVVLGGAASPELVRAFIDQWGPAQGLTDIYGDPARGFAGSYLP